jgi:transcriptional regulator with XRE-family HTH domain
MGGNGKMQLRDMREEKDLTQREVAAILYIQQNTYSQYEAGQRQIPVTVLIHLAEYFHTSVDYILELTDVPYPYPRTHRRKR